MGSGAGRDDTLIFSQLIDLLFDLWKNCKLWVQKLGRPQFFHPWTACFNLPAVYPYALYFNCRLLFSWKSCIIPLDLKKTKGMSIWTQKN